MGSENSQRQYLAYHSLGEHRHILDGTLLRKYRSTVDLMDIHAYT